MSEVKICGITTVDAAKSAIESGARFLGFIFYPESPRYINPESIADLLADISEDVKTVGVFVNPDDKDIKDVLSAAPIDMIQLHGDESPERVREIRHRFSLPIIKVFRLSHSDDINAVDDYIPTVDWLLFDAKESLAVKENGSDPTFDWTLLTTREFLKPWMLSGGLTAQNIKTDLIKRLKPRVLDVSHGVESKVGVKDSGKIKAFIKSARDVPVW